ncbi:MAG TPA: hypothetical protein PLB97_10420 [Accumulibacter sp.]|nr:hypothetical protein [Accumulibacter sp.]HPP47607.1 hypothetical protein [Accumulibacter sp.]
MNVGNPPVLRRTLIGRLFFITHDIDPQENRHKLKRGIVTPKKQANRAFLQILGIFKKMSLFCKFFVVGDDRPKNIDFVYGRAKQR